MTEDEKRAQAIASERRMWWQLAETYARCVAIARDEWDDALHRATEQQEKLALEMRDRTAKGVRATGKEFDADRHVPVPLLTPRDKLQFVKEVATTLLIQASQQHLPVTPEGKRAAQKVDATEPPEAGSGADETLDLEAEQLARAAEAAALGGGAFSLSEATGPDVSTLGANGE